MMSMENLHHRALAPALALICVGLPPPAQSQSIFERYAEPAGVEALPAEGEAVRALLQAEIDEALLGADIPPGAEASIAALSSGPAEAVLVDSFDFDLHSGRFTAIVLDTHGRRGVMHGRAPVTVPAWMPLRRIEAGEVVREADLGLFRLPAATARPNLLLHPSDMVDKEARRALMAERPVPDRSLAAPRAVLRGAAVTISLGHDGLTLAAPGKSLEDGALGQLIRVVNTQSNKIVHAEVVGEAEVRVRSAGPTDIQ